MKLLKSLIIWIITILIFASFTIELKLHEQIPALSPEESTISDRELDELLKEPKYQKLAKSMGMSVSDLTLPADEIDKFSPKKTEEKKDEELFFSTFNFISKQKLKTILDKLNQPIFSSYLPQEAKVLIEKALKFESSFANNDQINNYIDNNMANTHYSEAYIDPDGVISRKGLLTIINKNKKEYKSYLSYCVSNSKVISFFSTSNKDKIIKTYRNSQINVKDINSSPCFYIMRKMIKQNDDTLICATSVNEKELWYKTIKSHLSVNN